MRLFSCLKKELSLGSFRVFVAQTCPQRAMLGAVWCTGLLLSLLRVCASLEEECVLGVVGHPVSLPCVYPNFLTSVNLSIEWRRGEEVVLRSLWREDGDVEEWSINRATTPEDAALTGDFSLQLPSIDPTQNNTHYSMIVTSEGNQSSELCSVCLRTAASFSPPLLQREGVQRGGERSFSCHSSGGFPEPELYWLINNTEYPPEEAVRTLAAPLPDSNLFNISSRLTVNISKDASVTCIVENRSLNETLTSTTSAVKSSAKGSRASEAMWIFSTALSVVVGVMVLTGVIYQIHLDRISKRKKHEYQKEQTHRGNKRRSPDKEEVEAMKPEGIETDV